MRTKRVKTNTSGTVTDTYTYVYNGSQLSQMTKNGNVLNFFYDGEGRPSYFTYNNATYYYVTNLQGDVVAILDSTGAVMVNYHYDAYGDLMVIEDIGVSMLSWLNPLRYRGYVYDNETGLYYLQSRYYNPTIRQFISADALISTGQGYIGYNLFAYCGNNPVKNLDSQGTYYVSVEDRFGPGYIDGGSTPQAAPQPSYSYINDQEDESVASMRLGWSNVSDSGCGPIAVYNTLISMGYGRSFEYVLAYFNHNILNRMYWLGFAGTRVKHIKGFFESEGFSVTLTSDYDEIDALSKTADGCILYYEWESNTWMPPYYAHFVSCCYTSSGYEYYNVEGLFGEPSDLLKAKKATSATAIFIFK